MSDIYYLNADHHGTAFLAVGDSVVLFDPGMAYAASDTIHKIHEIVSDRVVDAVFLTHSHYDHVAALPSIKDEWPDVIVYGSAYCQQILAKDNVLEAMEKLSRFATEKAGRSWDTHYQSSKISVDKIVHDGDQVKIGGMSIDVIETQGHTKCSLSFLVDDLILVASESQGIVEFKGTYSPQFLTGYQLAVDSVNKCRQYPIQKYCMPHQGVVENPDAAFWDGIIRDLQETKNQILQILDTYEDPEERLLAMEKVFWNEKRQKSWPRKAFRLNAQAMLNTIEREFKAV